MTDVIGKIVLMDELISVEGNNMKNIDLGSLPEGIYLLTLQSFVGDRAVSIKVVIE